MIFNDKILSYPTNMFSENKCFQKLFCEKKSKKYFKHFFVKYFNYSMNQKKAKNAKNGVLPAAGAEKIAKNRFFDSHFYLNTPLVYDDFETRGVFK